MEAMSMLFVDFNNKKEAREVEETTRKLFGPFFYAFSIRND